MDVSVEQSWVPRFERHELDTPASWWRWEQEVAPGKAEHAMAYMRAWNPFDRKFARGSEGPTAPDPNSGTAPPLNSATDRYAGPRNGTVSSGVDAPETHHEVISGFGQDGWPKPARLKAGEWFVYLIGWMRK